MLRNLKKKSLINQFRFPRDFFISNHRLKYERIKQAFSLCNILPRHNVSIRFHQPMHSQRVFQCCYEIGDFILTP